MFKPTTFGKFFLYEKLAIGGMAEIFKAKLYGIAGFEKTLVVKQILPEYASDSEFVNMFIDEANIAVSLTHGNIVPVYELGKIADRYYIAMEYVDGENLETVIDQCRKMKRDIPVNLCTEIAIEVCKGLDYAHKKLGPEGVNLGIVHRDVSPQNVMLSFDGEVKIVDFGIAKAASKLSLTRVGTLKGKFGYMSPEQAMGNEVDRRTDIYAIGIVLYEILTGTKLYDAENDLDLLKRVRAGAVLPPRMVNPRVSPELDRIVLKGLAKNIDERYQEASQFQMDLQRWLYSQPASSNAETLAGFMRTLFRREGAPRPTPAPAPQVPPKPPPVDRLTAEDGRRSRRDLSFAQNDEIVKALEQAANEARRVMGEDPAAATKAPEAKKALGRPSKITQAPPPPSASPFGSPFGAVPEEVTTGRVTSAPDIPIRDDDDRPTTGGDLSDAGADRTVVQDNQTSSSDTHDAVDGGGDVFAMSTNVVPVGAPAGGPTATATSTATATADEVIEWDETTDRNIRKNLLDGAPKEYVERPTGEGPIVRVPPRAKNMNSGAFSPAQNKPMPSPPVPKAHAKEIVPPWQVGPIPAATDDGETRPWTGDPPTKGSSSRPRASKESGPVPALASAEPTSTPAVDVGEPPLFSESRKRAVRRRPIARIALFALAGLLLAATGAGWAFRDRLEPLLASLSGEPAGGHPKHSATPRATATPEHVDATGTATPTAVAQSSVAATPTATPTPAATSTTAPPAVRKVALHSTPSGAQVFEGTKLLGKTPIDDLSVPVSDDLAVRYVKSGFHDLKKTYPAGTDPLDAEETLDPVAVATRSTPSATPRPPQLFGTISVNATPWGEVRIDGVKVKNTPVLHWKVKAGPHTVVVSNPELKKSETRKVVVRANVDEDPIIVSFE